MKARDRRACGKTIREITVAVFLTFVTASMLCADPVKCDLSEYRASNGLTATVEQEMLVVTWTGERGAELRVTHAIDRAQPVIRELALRQRGGPWQILGRNLTPEYRVTSGVRRMSNQQAQPLRQLGVEITPPSLRQDCYQFDQQRCGSQRADDGGTDGHEVPSDSHDDA